MNKQALLGRYLMMGLVLDIGLEDGQLLAAIPTVPPGYESRLDATADPLRFIIRGGTLDGSSATFSISDNEETTLRVGPFTLQRVDEAAHDTVPITERLLPPAVDWTPEKAAAFDALLDQIAAGEDTLPLAYSLPFPKHEFVQYTMQQDRYIFHGSNSRTIDEFAPIRKSMELNDENGRGNLQAIYGTHDGLWSMFFAVVDRGRLQGTIRNGTLLVHDRDGRPLTVYNFSINQHQLAERPYTAGALYFLPRSAFTRLEMMPGILSDEWACQTALKPLARLDLEPADFPFLEQIGGHDDGPMIRLGALTGQIRAAARRASFTDEQFVIVIDETAAVVEHLAEYQELLQQVLGQMGLAISSDADGLTLTFSDIPPAVQQLFRHRYADLL